MTSEERRQTLPRSLYRWVLRQLGALVMERVVDKIILVAAGVLATYWVTTVKGICNRTEQVQAAIMVQVGTTDCRDINDADLARIEVLSIRPINRLQAHDFQGLYRLSALDLSENGLRTLPAGVFDGLVGLNQLSLKGNSLSGLPAGTLSTLPTLTTLDLSENDLQDLPSDLLALVKLERLDVSRNRIGLLDVSTIGQLFRLATLDLSDNQLTHLPPRVLHGLSNLQSLDLERNPGAPFSLTVAIQRVDQDSLSAERAKVAVTVAEGAPFRWSVALTTDGGELSSDTVVLARGDTISAAVEIRWLGADTTMTVFPVGDSPDTPASIRGVRVLHPGRLPLRRGTSILQMAETPSEMNETRFDRLLTEEIALGRVVRGTLTRDDSVGANGAYYDLWRLEIEDDSVGVRVHMTSAEVDPYLSVNAMGENVGFDDDSGRGLNADLRLMLGRGSYTIVASSYAGGETGAYELDVVVQDGGDVNMLSNLSGVTQVGELTATDERREGGQYYDEWILQAMAGERWTITMESSEVDSYLTVIRNGERMAVNDDGGGRRPLDSRLEFVVPVSGRYIVRATTYGGSQTGAYRIGAEVEDNR